MWELCSVFSHCQIVTFNSTSQSKLYVRRILQTNTAWGCLPSSSFTHYFLWSLENKMFHAREADLFTTPVVSPLCYVDSIWKLRWWWTEFFNQIYIYQLELNDILYKFIFVKPLFHSSPLVCFLTTFWGLLTAANGNTQWCWNRKFESINLNALCFSFSLWVAK